MDEKKRIDDAFRNFKKAISPFNEYTKGQKSFKDMTREMAIQQQFSLIDSIVEFLIKDPGTCSDIDIQTGLKKFFQVDNQMYIIHKHLKLLEHHGFIHENSGRYSISMKGVFEGKFSHYYEKLQLKEEADFKLKQISISSIKVNKWLPLYAIILALITAVIPLFIYYKGMNHTQKTETSIPQLEQAIKIQERMLQTQQLYLDSILTLMNRQKKN